MYYRYCPTVKSLLNVPLNHISHLRFLSDAKCPFEIQNLLNVKTFLSPTEKIFGQKKKKKCGTQSDLRREKLLKDEFAKWNLKKKKRFCK